MARGMDLNDKYLYAVVFDNERPSDWQPLMTYAYGPYTTMGPAKRMLKQENGRWNQINGKIMRTKVKWEEVE